MRGESVGGGSGAGQLKLNSKLAQNIVLRLYIFPQPMGGPVKKQDSKDI